MRELDRGNIQEIRPRTRVQEVPEPQTEGALARALQPAYIEPEGVVVDFATRQHTDTTEEEVVEACDAPYGAFGQLAFIESHMFNGKVRKKVSLYSMAAPASITAMDFGRALQEGIGEKLPITAWRGVNKGRKIIAMEKEVETHDYSMIKRFTEAAGGMVAGKIDENNEYRQEFLAMQQNRLDAMDMLTNDMQALAENPEFTGHSPFNPRYKGVGGFVQEMYMDEDGILMGTAPDGRVLPVVGIAADDPHRKWLTWFQAKVRLATRGVVGDAEDDTIKSCGNNKEGCAKFFKMMEGSAGVGGEDLVKELAQRNISPYESMMYGPSIGASETQHMCDKCGSTCPPWLGETGNVPPPTC